MDNKLDLSKIKEVDINEAFISDATIEANSVQLEEDAVAKETPEQRRERIKLWIAGILALLLWVCLITLIAYHLYQINNFSNSLASLDNAALHKDRAEFIKQASLTFDNTAKSIYAFLTPIVAGVTAYFFNISRNP